MPDLDTQHTIWRTGDQCPDCCREINTDGRHRWCASPHCDWTDYPNSGKSSDNE
jgi:hypothetical protein